MRSTCGSLAHQLFLEDSSAKVNILLFPFDPLGRSATDVSKVGIEAHVGVTELRGR